MAKKKCSEKYKNGEPCQRDGEFLGMCVMHYVQYLKRQEKNKNNK